MYRRLIRILVANRELIWEMGVRELKSLNKGSFLGWSWIVLSPLIQVLAYVAIVGVVFRPARDSTDHFAYTLYVLAGMIPWQLLTRALQDAPMLIRDRIDLAKQMIYPLETLPLTSLVAPAVGATVSLAVYFACVLVRGDLKWSVLLLPIPTLLLVTFVLGTAWTLSIAGVVIRDLREITTVLLSLMVYVSPVVATPEITGPRLWRLILANPLAHVVICFRDVLRGTFHGWSWVIFVSLAVVMFTLGGWVMSRTRVLINEYI